VSVVFAYPRHKRRTRLDSHRVNLPAAGHHARARPSMKRTILFRVANADRIREEWSGGAPGRITVTPTLRRAEPRAVDVLTAVSIQRPVAEVVAFASAPSRAPAWCVHIKSVEWETPPPLAVGSRVAFVAHFLGRRLAYTHEIRTWVPGERLVMSTAAGPFPMETTYTWAAEGEGARMTLRHRGEPAGFSAVMAPLMVRMMRRANTVDLAKLKAVLEDERSA